MLNLGDKKILVTGGAGFLGKQVVEQLCEAGAVKNKITIPRSRDLDLCGSVCAGRALKRAACTRSLKQSRSSRGN